eukprot:gene8568-11578_t
MKLLELLMNALSLCSLIILSVTDIKASTAIHICESEDPLFIGTYTPSREQMDGVPVFTNNHEMSFFRSKGFWYIGNLGPWPPETHYRCVEVEECNYLNSTPAATINGNWKGSKRYNKVGTPLISLEPCANPTDEL